MPSGLVWRARCLQCMSVVPPLLPLLLLVWCGLLSAGVVRPPPPWLLLAVPPNPPPPLAHGVVPPRAAPGLVPCPVCGLCGVVLCWRAFRLPVIVPLSSGPNGIVQLCV